MNLGNFKPIQGRNMHEANTLLRVAISMWRDDTGLLTDALENLVDACEFAYRESSLSSTAELEHAMRAGRELAALSKASLLGSQHI